MTHSTIVRLTPVPILLLAGCARPTETPRTDTLGRVPAAIPVAPSTSDAAHPWTPAQACDSVAELARRAAANAVITRGTDSFNFGPRRVAPACRVTIAIPDLGTGGAPITFEDGIGDREWAQVIELLSDGEDGHGYGLRRPGVLCKGFEGTSGSATYTATLTCGAEPMGAADRPPPGRVFDSALAVIRNGEDACYHYPDLTVAANELDTSLGSDIFVRAGPDAPCTFDSLPGDFVLRNEWAEYYMGKAGRVLILDSGTGIVRSMIFWDLDRRRQFYEGSYVGGIEEAEGGLLGVWRATRLDLASKGCAIESQAVVEAMTWVEVATGRERPADRYRCGFEE